MCIDKCNCICDASGSCLAASECLQGFFGANCDALCHCDSCDRTMGCTDKECLAGFYGPNCETECHCLNGAACDRETGKCKADPTTQLSLCEPGYASNTTGFNLDNCQKRMFEVIFFFFFFFFFFFLFLIVLLVNFSCTSHYYHYMGILREMQCNAMKLDKKVGTPGPNDLSPMLW